MQISRFTFVTILCFTRALNASSDAATALHNLVDVQSISDLLPGLKPRGFRSQFTEFIGSSHSF